MIVRRHEDLLAWQLGMLVHQRVVTFLAGGRARNDRCFCTELLEASEAISANIAEGFDRYRLPQFRYFLQVAKGSLAETSTRVRQGYVRRYFTEKELNELLVLCRRTRAVLGPLITSVEAQIERGGFNIRFMPAV